MEIKGVAGGDCDEGISRLMGFLGVLKIGSDCDGLRTGVGVASSPGLVACRWFGELLGSSFIASTWPSSASLPVSSELSPSDATPTISAASSESSPG